MAGPLEGVRVLEFSEIIAGPFAGALLADMGADVIKVEPPWGDPWRFAREFIPGESRQFMSLNRGKRSLPLDLTKAQAREVVYRLVPDMDVVLINARPDVAGKLGIDYETLSKINPCLIYCDNTAFGRKGPHSHRPGYDIIAQAMSGLMASEDKIEDGVPQRVLSTAVADHGTGLAMAWAVCAALYSRERTGRGQMIETTLLGTSLAFLGDRFIQVDVVDLEPRTQFLQDLADLRSRGASYEDAMERYREMTAIRQGAYYRTYRAKDGVLAVGCLSDPLRKRMADLLRLDDIRFEPGYDPDSDEALASMEEVATKAEALFLQRSVDEWLALLDKEGVPAGPVRFVEELIDDEQVTSNQLVVELDHSVAGRLKMVAPCVSMSDTPLEATSASPALGEHSSEILSGLGYTGEEIQRLRDGGVTR